MARPLRIQYEGAFHHITARGNEGGPIFREDKDLWKFLDTLSEVPARFSVVVHAYVLMSNHYHLLVETPEGKLSRAMHFLNTAYTVFFNRRHKRVGHLFQGRYKSILIEKDRYFLAVSRYIHLNPVRAGIVAEPEDYRWSSYADYITSKEKSAWLCCNLTLDQFSKNRAQARSLYEEFVQEAATSEDNPFEKIKSGFILGDEGFTNEIREKIASRRCRETPETGCSAEESLNDMICAVSGRFAVTEEEILRPGSRNNTARNVCIYLFRSHTSTTQAEIGRLFDIGTTGVHRALSRAKNQIIDDKRLKSTVEEIESELFGVR